MLSNAQDITGNIVTNECTAWSGNKICTAGGGWSGGYSGGNVPNISETGTIRFGYTNQTVAQVIAINQALSQTGIQVDGYNYSWNIRNSNADSGQSFGAQDPLKITVQITDRQGAVVESYTYDYSYWIMNWTNFSGSETFSQSYLAQDLNTLNLTVAGRDAGYWAGYYGPEVSNIDVRLRYSAAPPPPPEPQPQPEPQPVAQTTPVVEEERELVVVEVVSLEPAAEVAPVVEIIAAQEPEASSPATEQAGQQSQESSQQSSGSSEQSQQQQATSQQISIAMNSAAGPQQTEQTEKKEERSRAVQEAKQQAVTEALSPISPISITPSLTSQLEQVAVDSQTEKSVASGNSENNGSSATEVAETKVEDPETKEQNQAMSSLASNDRLDAYSKTIPDRDFYVSVQVYKNIIVPENKRGLRMGLASEILWDKMVDQQYK